MSASLSIDRSGDTAADLGKSVGPCSGRDGLFLDRVYSASLGVLCKWIEDPDNEKLAKQDLRNAMAELRDAVVSHQ